MIPLQTRKIKKNIQTSLSWNLIFVTENGSKIVLKTFEIIIVRGSRIFVDFVGPEWKL